MKTNSRNRKARPPIYMALNPETDKWEQVFSESELPAGELIIPMFWAGNMYVTVPGTEFYGCVPEGGYGETR